MCSTRSSDEDRLRRAVLPGVPEPLERSVAALLHRRPERRPGDARFFRRRRPRSRHRAERRRGSRAARRPSSAEAQSLASSKRPSTRAQAGHARWCSFTGSSGVGKTALVRRFLAGPRGGTRARCSLSGRCYERESVPYKALDSLVDRSQPLSAHAAARRRRRAAAARRPGADAAVSRCCSASMRWREPLPVAGGRQRAGTPPPQLRRVRRAAGAAERSPPVVLVVDDLQWGDSDSAALITDLMFGDDAPALLFVACYRFERCSAVAQRCVRWFWRAARPRRAATCTKSKSPSSASRSRTSSHRR